MAKQSTEFDAVIYAAFVEAAAAHADKPGAELLGGISKIHATLKDMADHQMRPALIAKAREEGVEAIKLKYYHSTGVALVAAQEDLAKLRIKHEKATASNATAGLLATTTARDRIGAMTDAELASSASSYLADPGATRPPAELNILSVELRSRGEPAVYNELRAAMQTRRAHEPWVHTDAGKVLDAEIQLRSLPGFGEVSFLPMGETQGGGPGSPWTQPIDVLIRDGIEEEESG